MRTEGVVEAVCKSPAYTMSKPVVDSIRQLEGLGVEDDAHQGVTLPPAPHHALGPV